MANYNELKASIEQQIRSNGNQEITGAVLQAAMLNMVDVLGENAAWGGVITPTSTHAGLNTNTLYLASEAGTYANFGGVSVEKDEIAAIYYDGSSFTKQTVMKVGQVLANLVGTSQEVLNMLAELAEYLAQDPNMATSLASALAGKVNKSGDDMTGDLSAPVVRASIAYKDLTPDQLMMLKFSKNAATDKYKEILNAQITSSYQAGSAIVELIEAGYYGVFNFQVRSQASASEINYTLSRCVGNDEKYDNNLYAVRDGQTIRVYIKFKDGYNDVIVRVRTPYTNVAIAKQSPFLDELP